MIDAIVREVLQFDETPEKLALTEKDARMSKYCQVGSFPHLIFYGPMGSGKRAKIRFLLKKVFGDSAISKTRFETIKVGTGEPFKCIASYHHYEIFASTLGFKDRECIQEGIKKLAQYQAPTVGSANQFKVFVIHEAHCLSLPAQAGLRRTLEKLSLNSRIILSTDRLASLITPLRSRCVCLRVSLPLASRALNDVTWNAKVSACWQKEIEKLCQIRDARELLKAGRDVIPNLLVCGIDGCKIVELIAQLFYKRCPDLCAQAASYFSFTMASGSKPLLHIEAFLATLAVALEKPN